MNSAPQLRTLLILGRVSNLPTVWSNCLAGWWLSGGGNFAKLPFLFLGLSLLYTGGGFLNDAFDEDFDRQRRSERPIPSGKISARLVWQLGFVQLALGLLLLLVCGKSATVAGVWLLFFILLYNFTHKFLTASPWVMGMCRFWVYIIAGATGVGGLNGFVIFCGLGMALYVVGLSYVAKRESVRGVIPHWPLLPLVAPILLALLMNAGTFRPAAIWISVVVFLWLARSLRTTFFGGERNIGWIVTNLFAGITFVDWLAVAPILPPVTSALVFVALFGLTKWFQKFIPAT
jgi:4-hydroxybenzoate polyprenyltransferase